MKYNFSKLKIVNSKLPQKPEASSGSTALGTTASGSGTTAINATVWVKVFILLIILIKGSFVFSQHVDYSSNLPTGAQAKIEIKELHPTQFAVGMGEVYARAKKLDKLSKDELKEYLKERTAPVVIGPEGKAYLLDHHHLAAALNEIGKDHMYIEVKANWMNLPPTEFTKQMLASQWCWLYDENGKGPLEFSQLPEKIKDLKDDPFRTLVWQLREDEIIEKVETPFAEFAWAQALRTQIEKQQLKDEPQKAYKIAIEFAQSKAAEKLPGYKGACDTKLVH